MELNPRAAILVFRENLMFLWLTSNEWEAVLIIVAAVAASLFALSFWPKPGKHRGEAHEASIEMKLYTADLQRGTQHWHDYPNAPRPMWADPVPHLEEPEADVTDLSLLRLTPANETQGASEEWSPVAAIEAVTDFVVEQAQDIVPWEHTKRDFFAMADQLDDMRWELEFAKLDDMLEEQARRCDAAVEAINPGKQLVLVS